MKKFVAALGLLVTLFLLVACQSHPEKNSSNTDATSKRQTADFQKIDTNYSDVRYHFTYEGDDLLISQQTTTILYSALNVNSPESARFYYEQNGSTKWDDIEGIEHKVEYQGDRLVETITVDYTKVDKVANAALLEIQLTNGKAPKQISYKHITQTLIGKGFSEVKDGNFQTFN